MESVSAQIKHFELGASSQGHWNAPFKIIPGHIQQLKPGKMTELTRYSSHELVVSKVQLR